MNEDRIISMLHGVLDAVSAVNSKVDSMDKRLIQFQAQTQDDFAIVKTRLRRIEDKLDEYEERISVLEKRQ